MTIIDMNDVDYVTETTLTIRQSRRRTTVPKEIVDALGFVNGDKIRWLLFHDGRIMISKVQKKKE